MHSAEAQKRTGMFLPDICTDGSSKQRSTLHRMKRVKEGLQTSLTSDKPAGTLSRKEVALFGVSVFRFRNNAKQNICVETLQQGNHRSFSELFSLLSSDQDWRSVAHPESARLKAPPLEEQPVKLDTISLHLNRAEQAERTGSWSVVCEERLLLGHYFSSPEDLWLSLHFYRSCTDREGGHWSRAATEARACLAELYLQQGDLEEAQCQAELCINQAELGSWLDSDGGSLKRRGCGNLSRICGQLADAPLASGDFNQALTLLQRAHNLAKEAEDRHMEGEALFLLGLVYQRAGNHHMAKKFFDSSILIFDSLQEMDRLVKACKAKADTFQSEGRTDEMIQCLEKVADICRGSGLQHNLADICLTLGTIYYHKGEYTRACEYFQQCYEVSCDINVIEMVQKAKVMMANARAHTLIRKYSADVVSASPTALERLIQVVKPPEKERRKEAELLEL
ncbi:tetratricopeptide repeat protein 29 [Pholidichthys leucotaenia]